MYCLNNINRYSFWWVQGTNIARKRGIYKLNYFSCKESKRLKVERKSAPYQWGLPPLYSFFKKSASPTLYTMLKSPSPILLPGEKLFVASTNSKKLKSLNPVRKQKLAASHWKFIISDMYSFFYLHGMRDLIFLKTGIWKGKCL